jgi:hypothetical protein
MRVTVVLALIATAVGQVALDYLNLPHMGASMGWVWNDGNQRVIGWWAIIAVVSLLLAGGALARSRLATIAALIWSSLLALLWLWWTVMYLLKAARVDNPELYLFAVPGIFTLAYAVASAGAVRMLTRQRRNGAVRTRS